MRPLSCGWGGQKRSPQVLTQCSGVTHYRGLQIPKSTAQHCCPRTRFPHEFFTGTDGPQTVADRELGLILLWVVFWVVAEAVPLTGAALGLAAASALSSEHAGEVLICLARRERSPRSPAAVRPDSQSALPQEGSIHRTALEGAHSICLQSALPQMSRVKPSTWNNILQPVSLQMEALFFMSAL